VRRRQVTCSAVSGKPLARTPCVIVLGTNAGLMQTLTERESVIRSGYRRACLIHGWGHHDRTAERDGHVPVQRHRGVHAASRAAGRPVCRGPGRAPAAAIRVYPVRRPGGGTEGDTFFVAFDKASQAVAAAVAGQQLLAEHPWPEAVVVPVRMGIHTGEPIMVGQDYAGLRRRFVPFSALQSKPAVSQSVLLCEVSSRSAEPGVFGPRESAGMVRLGATPRGPW
jgi:hypothetical protein